MGGLGLRDEGETCLGVLYVGTEIYLNLPETPSNPSCAAVTVPREICPAGRFLNAAVSVSCCLVTNCPSLDVLKQLVCIIGNECTVQLNGSSGPLDSLTCLWSVVSRVSSAVAGVGSFTGVGSAGSGLAWDSLYGTAQLGCTLCLLLQQQVWVCWRGSGRAVRKTEARKGHPGSWAQNWRKVTSSACVHAQLLS